MLNSGNEGILDLSPTLVARVHYSSLMSGGGTISTAVSDERFSAGCTGNSEAPIGCWISTVSFLKQGVKCSEGFASSVTFSPSVHLSTLDLLLSSTPDTFSMTPVYEINHFIRYEFWSLGSMGKLALLHRLQS